MAKASKKINALNTTAAIIAPEAPKVDQIAQVEQANEIEYVTMTLPKGTKVTASKRTIIAPPHEITANKERWFEVKRLKGYKVEAGIVTITIAKSALGYRQMVKED